MLGDNILTAVSVARQCDLVPPGDQLVFVNATLPDDNKPASISWDLATDSCADDTGTVPAESSNCEVAFQPILV